MLLSYSFILCLVESSGVEKIWKFTHKFFRTLSGSHETTNERLELEALEDDLPLSVRTLIRLFEGSGSICSLKAEWRGSRGLRWSITARRASGTLEKSV